MKNKKGILRIIEAFVAVMLIAGFMVVLFYVRTGGNSDRNSIVELERIILEKIASDDELRAAVLAGFYEDSAGEGNKTILRNEIRSLLPSEYDFTFEICELNEICGLQKNSKEYTQNSIYAEEVSVSSTLFTYTGSKKIRLFVWSKD